MLKEFAFLVILAMATQTMADDANQSQEPTEEQVEEVVFNVSKELVSEVETAVKTINEVFGNPACEQTGATKRGLEIEKRIHWGHAAAGAAVALLGKKKRAELEERSEVKAEKRGWKDFWQGAAVVSVLGKRYADKRDGIWGQVLKSAAKGACQALDKRDAASAPIQANSQDETPEDEVQFQADVAKLKEAVGVLNEVLIVAEASIEN